MALTGIPVITRNIKIIRKLGIEFMVVKEYEWTNNKEGVKNDIKKFI